MRYELSHDSIARLVFSKASVEAQMRRKVEKYIRDRHEAHLNRGAKLTQDDIDFIYPYLAQVNISKAEADFVEEGRRALIWARRRRRMLVGAIVAVMAAFSVGSFMLYKNAEKAKDDALLSEQNAYQATEKAQDEAGRAKREKAQAEIARQRAEKSDSIAQEKALAAHLSDSLAQLQTQIALSEKAQAELQTREAEALAITAVTRLLPEEDNIAALQLMKLSYSKTLPEPPPPIVSQSLSKRFYDQIGKPRRMLYDAICKGHTDWISSAVFSPDGKYILTASEDMTTRIWDLQGKEVATCKGHTSYVYSAVFSPDGKYILTASSQDNTARIWPTPARIYEYLVEESPIPDLTAEQQEASGIR